MNPFEWTVERRWALILAFLVGAFFGVILGYFVFIGGDPPGAHSFEFWLTQPIVGYIETSMGGVALSGGLAFVAAERFWWGLCGGLIGMALFYIAELRRR